MVGIYRNVGAATSLTLNCSTLYPIPPINYQLLLPHFIQLQNHILNIYFELTFRVLMRRYRASEECQLELQRPEQTRSELLQGTWRGWDKLLVESKNFLRLSVRGITARLYIPNKSSYVMDLWKIKRLKLKSQNFIWNLV